MTSTHPGTSIRCLRSRASCALILLGALLAHCARLAGTEVSSPTLYDGRTLAEWRERIQRLDFQGVEIGREVPGLLAIAKDVEAPWFSRRQAALTLGRIGAPAQGAIPELVALLDERAIDPEQSPQLWVMKSLALFGPLAADATPTLVSFLEDEARASLPRLAAIEALGRIGPGEPRVLPALTRAIDAGIEVDRNQLRQPVESAPLPGPPPESGGRENRADTLERAVAAAEMLELFGSSAAPVTPSLIRATAAHDVFLRRAAANTLGLIGPAADPAVPALADLVLFDDSHEVRDLAARSLGRIGESGEAVLTQMLADADMEVRVRAASACRELASAEATTIASLTAAVDDPEPTVRIAALESLWKLQAEPKVVVPAAIVELSSSERDVRMRAVRLLESTGSQVEPWLPKLRMLAKSESGTSAQAARRVLRTHAARANDRSP